MAGAIRPVRLLSHLFQEDRMATRVKFGGKPKKPKAPPKPRGARKKSGGGASGSGGGKGSYKPSNDPIPW